MCDCIKLCVIFHPVILREWRSEFQTLLVVPPPFKPSPFEPSKQGVQRSEVAILTQKQDTTPYMVKSGL